MLWLRSLVSTKVFLAKVIGRHRMQLRSENLHFGKRCNHGTSGSGRAEQIRQYNALLLHAVLSQYVYSLQYSISSGHDWIHEQHLTTANVIGKTCIDNACLVCIGIRFDQDLSNSYRAAAVA